MHGSGNIYQVEMLPLQAENPVVRIHAYEKL